MSGSSNKINKNKLNEDNTRTLFVTIPPDGGWGWVIMIASFCCNTIVDGIVFNSGFIQADVENDFKLTKAQVGFVSSLLSGFYLLAGPFVSLLSNKIGFRLTTITGTLIAATGFALSFFANNVYFLYISYGIIGGIGFCLVYIPSVLTVGYYFQKWRALATGISLCGSGVGTFIFAPITESLVQTYGWRHTVLIESGIILLCGVFACFFKPLKPTEVTEHQMDTGKNELKASKILEKRYAYSVPTSAHTTWIKNQSSVYPKAVDIFYEKNNGEGFELKELQPLAEQDDETEETKKGQNSSQILRRNTISEKGSRPWQSARTSVTLRRDDIFLFGSLNRLPKYTSQSSIAYHVSVTHGSVQMNENTKKEKTSLIDMELFKSPSFTLLALSGFFTMSGFFVPFLYITQRAREASNENFPGYLIPCIGISNTIGRILCGFISSSTGVDALHLNNIFIILGGLATVFSGISMTIYWQISYCIIFGFAIACFSALRSIITVELLGLEKLTNAFGILMMFQGIAAIIGGPLAGYFMDLTNSYNVSFYIAGGLITFSAVLCLPLNAINHWEKNKSKIQDSAS